MAARTSSHSTSKMMPVRAPILLVGGDKGGVGKSFLTRVIVAWLRSRERWVVGFDGDARNAHLDRYYSSTMPVSRPYLQREHGFDDMFEGWEAADDAAVILVDTPAGIGDRLEAEGERIRLIAHSLNRPIMHIWVGDEEEDSVTLFDRLHPLADLHNTLVVLNGRFGTNAKSFELWLESQIRADLLAAGGAETFIPPLPIRPRTKIARAQCGFDDVRPANLMTFEKVDFDIWWSKIERALLDFSTMMERLS